MKHLTQRLVNAFGYRIERAIDRVEAPIDVLDLLLTKLTAHVSDFFFIQLGANDGVTDDPIRKYVTKHHWRGLLVEPQPQVFQSLLKNYQEEKQLVFENAAIADQDGMARFFVGEKAESGSNLTVFSSLKKETLMRGLRRKEVLGGQAKVKEIEVPALSAQTLITKHQVTKIDLLQTDVQGYDCEVVQQFLACGIKPTVIHFEIYHATQAQRQECYRALVAGGYRFIEFEIDTVAYRGPQGL